MGNEWTALDKLEKEVTQKARNSNLHDINFAVFLQQKYIREGEEDKKRYKHELEEYQNSEQYQEFMQKKGEGRTRTHHVITADISILLCKCTICC